MWKSTERAEIKERKRKTASVEAQVRPGELRKKVREAKRREGNR